MVWRLLLLISMMTACQRVVEVEVDPGVTYFALLDLEGRPLTGLMERIPRQDDDSTRLLIGFTRDQIDPFNPDFTMPLRSAAPCEGPLPSPAWVGLKEGRDYRASEESIPLLTADWMPPRCAEDEVCREGLCLDAVVEIDLGKSFGCARWASGQLSCWGDGYGAQAVPIEAVQEATALSAYRNDVCVVVAGQVSCLRQQEPLRSIDGLTNVLEVSVGRTHSCARDGAGAVHCWGLNEQGQLGDGTDQPSLTPLRVPFIQGATEVAAGGNHSCAVTAEGTTCWGASDAGEIGQVGATSPNLAAGPELAGLSAGHAHVCGVTTGGAVQCWGDNFFGQTGGGAPLDEARSVAVGPDGSCAIQSDGQTQCWGLGRFGALGTLLSAPFAARIPIPGPGLPRPVVQLAMGEATSCALDEGNEVWCWGYGPRGERGDGRTARVEAPREILSGVDVVQIAAGESLTCARMLDGEVLCWGLGDEGQLGRGDRPTAAGPGRVDLPAAAIDIDAGEAHACAVLSDGAVHCWGSNRLGQILPTSFDEAVPTPVEVLSDAVDVAVGQWHACAVRRDGRVYCWGFNNHGALGFGEAFTAAEPTEVPGVATASIAAAGVAQTCVGLADGRMQCWGLAASTHTVTDVVQIVMGELHGCARTGIGEVWCFGNNDDGQLGDGTRVEKDRAIQVPGLSDVVSLAAGARTVAAVRRDGTLVGWGTNGQGQLAEPGVESRDRPAPIGAVPAVLSVDAASHQCAAAVDRRVLCWGDNYRAAADPSDPPIEPMPQRVMGLEPR